ncbi:peptidoglycan-binding protein [Streptomyces clavuligerus]|nr:peptidoglycan-binding protein [Streptomyces clavuligerus]MBY6304690.1 peptidoglycan-binding protein [Streptomyces clavuligerus]QPL64683.1 peptidoglycan-binding protein [Streptomyces clavuligerus]QPL70713.1 peptidoglycan-binding protein [Streptomyces clavuligerus]QPL76796.1 peptidoglycan-binding protein [Streptomyces clavuligerus]QPL82822.1 peptidoglycan-binding protein [Streptomyces clavuligerus]
MAAPVFEEYEPAADCGCPGCVERRRVRAAGGHPAAQGCRRALVLVTAAGVVLGGGPAAHALGGPGAAPPVRDTDGQDQGGSAPLHGGPPPPLPPVRPLPGSALPGAGAFGGVPGGGAAGPERLPVPAGSTAASLPFPGVPAVPLVHLPGGPITRAEIIERARTWLTEKVPYSTRRYWDDGYRQDCSGYVSMAWNLPGNEWTGSLARYAVRIERAELQPGDMLLFHNPANPTTGSHVTLFGGWADRSRTRYIAYEQAKPHTRRQSTPMAYWNNSDRYLAYRYAGVVDSLPGTAGATEMFPGPSVFAPGAVNEYITVLGRMLVRRGAARFYADGPGPRWGDADRRATAAFQRAQGWKGREADGVPGKDTWRLLVSGRGKDIPAGAGTAAPPPAYPGPGHFRPGAVSPSVTRLGERLRQLGYGRHYTSGPGPDWGEADRRNVEAFQRAQGWSGTEADGYPGPHTWRRLFAPAPPAASPDTPESTEGTRAAGQRAAQQKRTGKKARTAGRPGPVRGADGTGRTGARRGGGGRP